MKKKILSLLLALTLLATMIPFAAVTVSAETDPYAVVVDIDGMQMTYGEFLGSLSSLSGYTGTITLLDNIVVGDSWVPVGAATTGNGFQGTLDGNGYTISGLTSALFECVEGGTVKNLTIESNVEITGNGNAGLIVNTVMTPGATFENVTLNGALTIGSEDAKVALSANAFYGAFVGFVKNGSISFTNCVNNADITTWTSANQNRAGGFIGNLGVESKFTSCKNTGNIQVHAAGAGNVGGFIGNTGGKATFTDCQNLGVVSCDSGSAGSLVGGFVGQTNKALVLNNCQNLGAVSATKAHGGSKAGAFLGVGASGSALTATSCVNFGAVSSYTMAGGLAGQISGALDVNGAQNFGSITVTGNNSSNAFASGFLAAVQPAATVTPVAVRDLANYGDINVLAGTSGQFAYATGIASLVTVNFTTFDNCVNYGKITSFKHAGGLIGRWTPGNSDGNATVMNNCMVLGTVTGGADMYVGALVGRHEKGGSITLNGCYYNTGVAGAAAIGNNAAGCTYVVDGAEAVTYDQLNLEKADIKMVGVQESKASEGKFNVRLIAGLNDLAYEKVGFDVFYVANNTVSTTASRGTDTVYTSVDGYNENGEKETYTAESFGDRFLTAVNINNVPDNMEVTFYVVPFVQTANGMVYGTAMTITYVNGVYTA